MAAAAPKRPQRKGPGTLSIVIGAGLAAAVLAAWGVSVWIYPFALGAKAGRSLVGSLVEMAGILPAMFILVGLFDVWVPRSVIERHLGRRSGSLAVLWMVLLATLQAGPLYAAFPVAVALWRKGTAPRNVFIYLGAFSAMKLPMLTFEVAFLGWRFSLVRTLVTLPVFIALGYLLERLLPADITLPALEGATGPGPDAAPGPKRARDSRTPSGSPELLPDVISRGDNEDPSP
jgi:uncharacterized membrane protein YraQ (UPF0718 family)